MYNIGQQKEVKVADPDNWYPEWDLRPGFDKKRDTIIVSVGITEWEDDTNTVTCYAKGSNHVIYSLSFTCADSILAHNTYTFYVHCIYNFAHEGIDTDWFLDRGFERFWKGN